MSETALHMEYRLYQSEDGAEWLLRTWEPDYPKTICFTDMGPDRDLLLQKAESFWKLYIEPKRVQRQEAEARRERDRLDRAAKKAAKAFPTPPTAA